MPIYTVIVPMDPWSPAETSFKADTIVDAARRWIAEDSRVAMMTSRIIGVKEVEDTDHGFWNNEPDDVIHLVDVDQWKIVGSCLGQLRIGDQSWNCPLLFPIQDTGNDEDFRRSE